MEKTGDNIKTEINDLKKELENFQQEKERVRLIVGKIGGVPTFNTRTFNTVFAVKGGISLTPVHTSGSIGNHGRLPTDIDGIGKAVFIGRDLSDIFRGSSMATRLYLSTMPSSRILDGQP